MRGHLKKRSKGSWSIVIDLGKDIDGKRRQKWYSIKGTKRDAEARLAELLNEINQGTFVEPNKMTVAAFLEKWLNVEARGAVSGKTFARYSEIVERHLIPALGSIELMRLQPIHVKEVYAKWAREGRVDGKGGLAPKTIRQHHRILSSALKTAVAWKLLVKNPCDHAAPPKVVNREMRALTEAETAELLHLAKSRSRRLYYPLLIAATTGIRRGELVGLKWDDVDLESRQLRIVRSVEQTKDGIVFKVPKTKRSLRTLALPAITVEGLRAHRKEQNERRLQIGPVWQDHDLVFPMDDGTVWRPDSLTSTYRELVRRHEDFAGVRFHDLRHTHATLLLAQGVNAKVVSERLGHSSVAFTLDTYGHVLKGMQEDAADRLGASLERAVSKALAK